MNRRPWKRRFSVRNDGEQGGTPPTPPPPDPKPDLGPNIQARIDELFGQKKQAEDSLGAVSRENAELRAKLIAAEERLALSNKRQEGSAQPGSGPTFTPPQPPAQPSDDISVIKDQLAKLHQELAHQRLEEQQIASLNKARQMIPGLAAGDPELIKATKEIFSRDEVLRRHPQGPMLAAAMAQQLRGSQAPTPSPEKLAGLSTPTPAPLTAIEKGAAGKQLETLNKEREEVMAKMRLPGGSDHWSRYQQLRSQISELEKQLKG